MRISFADLPPKLPPKGVGTVHHRMAFFCTHGTKSVLILGTQYHQTQQAVTKKMSQPFFFVVTPKNGDFDVLFSRSYFTRLSNRFTAVGLFCCRFSTAVRPHCGKNERIYFKSQKDSVVFKKFSIPAVGFPHR